jgi:hypothetical protein
MANEFWMSDRQWAVLEPLIPMKRRGETEAQPGSYQSHHPHFKSRLPLARLSGGVRSAHHDLQSVQPMVEGRHLAEMLEALVDPGSAGSQSIDSTASKAHRCAAGGKGGPKGRRPDVAAAGGQPRFMPSPTRPAV